MGVPDIGDGHCTSGCPDVGMDGIVEVILMYSGDGQCTRVGPGEVMDGLVKVVLMEGSMVYLGWS